MRMPAQPGADVLALHHDAAQRLVRTVDGLTDDDLAGDSLLPGWSRAHVVAHLALNADALAGVLDAVAHGREAVMYASAEARDSDIVDLAASDSSLLRERLLAGTSAFADTLAAMPADRWDATFSRTPGAPPLPVAAVPGMRWREVEIHHADLAAGYGSDDWPVEVAVAVLDGAGARPWPVSFRLLARDLARTWEYGDDAVAHDDPDQAAVATVTGESRDLAWWITGRGDGATLTCDQDRLPEVPKW